MSKIDLKICKSVGTKFKVQVQNETVELRENRCLFARMAIVARSRPGIDLVSRALFASDGFELPCTNKSKLFHILEDLSGKEPAAFMHVHSNTLTITKLL